MKPASRQVSRFRILVSELSNRSLGFGESDVESDYPTFGFLIDHALNDILFPSKYLAFKHGIRRDDDNDGFLIKSKADYRMILKQ